ncbi:putative pumilio homolog 7, chloroplastic [Neltuma alba]|uniref:putative pumilio homolog 7, chloroplastic n=1 Tax=Neltuma alba TaxID=207710 RepID=UPI0010A2AFD4|nr:putative pumilio homolog 7, chloroplastic [Prosopis alba]
MNLKKMKSRNGASQEGKDVYKAWAFWTGMKKPSNREMNLEFLDKITSGSMDQSTQFLRNGYPSDDFPAVELIPNPENPPLRELITTTYNITNKQILAAGNFGIGPSHDYARLLHENNTNQQNTNQQTLVGNFGIGPHHLVYEGLSQCNNTNNETLVIGNARIGPSPVYYNSPVGRILQRYNDITSLEVMRGRVVSMSKEEYGSEFLAILDAMASECTLVATNKSGCFVLQKCLSISTLELSYLLICAVTNRVTVLAPHQYGNYVVQYVIKLRLGEVNEAIVNQLRGCYVDLSVNKQASNVVENLLIFSTQKNVDIIVQEIINSPSFLYLLQDPFGNYVAQTALECSKGALYDALVSTISKHYRILCTDQYGKRVLDFMCGGAKKFYAQFRRH